MLQCNITGVNSVQLMIITEFSKFVAFFTILFSLKVGMLTGLHDPSHGMPKRLFFLWLAAVHNRNSAIDSRTLPYPLN